MHASESEISRANRTFWDSDAQRYHDDHTAYLSGFYWCPEMLHESDAQLLGTPEEVASARILEVGCGSAPCTQELQGASTLATGCDLSSHMLRHAKQTLPLVQADVLALPYLDDSFDIVFSAFGALPFVADLDAALAEIARVIRLGGRFVFSVTHPMRWVFPDDPHSMTAEIPYFARAYEEYDDNGALTYAEYHRTFGDWVRALRSEGFSLSDVLEPEWPDHLTEEWGQWSPERGRVFPGTAIFVTTFSGGRSTL